MKLLKGKRLSAVEMGATQGLASGRSAQGAPIGSTMLAGAGEDAQEDGAVRRHGALQLGGMQGARVCGSPLGAGASTKWAQTTRLETRTKEFSTDASGWVANPGAQGK